MSPAAGLEVYLVLQQLALAMDGLRMEASIEVDDFV